MNAVLGLVRRLATLPVLRRFTTVGVLMRLSFSLRASLVREPVRFVRNELRPGAGVLASYRLRESDVRIAVRHKSPDILILDELFAQREYVLPDEVADCLTHLNPPAPKVVDLGANIGLFGAWILGRFPAARIVALEPDPSNARVHRAAIAANGLENRWRLVEAAAATSAGRVRFAADSFTTSHAAGSDEEAIDVEAVDVFPLLAGADLVKIDIEGAEWPILADSRVSELDAAAIVLEYHVEGAPGPDPAAAAEHLLADAGFSVIARHPKDASTGVLWAVRKPGAAS